MGNRNWSKVSSSIRFTREICRTSCVWPGHRASSCPLHREGIKVSGEMHNDAFKRRLGFSFAVIISAYNFLLLHYYGTGV